MKTALVVDDHPSVRMALKMTLEKIGFTHVDECDNGAQAINQIKKGNTISSYWILVFLTWMGCRLSRRCEKQRLIQKSWCSPHSQRNSMPADA